MEKFQTDPNNDIAKEPYQGPSARVAAAGQGFLEHFMYAATGLIGAGVFAFIFHEPATKLVKGAQKLGTDLKGWSSEGSSLLDRSKDKFTDWMGGVLHVVFGDEEAAKAITATANANPKHVEWIENIAHDKKQGFGNIFLSHTLGAAPWVGKGFKQNLRKLDDRKATAIAFGGAAGVIGYVGGWLKAIFLGAKHGNRGKHQFERAQAEIENLRETNDNLNKINDELHAKVVEVSTKFKDTAASAASAETAEKSQATVSEPATMATETNAEAAEEKPTPAIKNLAAAEHHGKLAAARAAEPEMA